MPWGYLYETHQTQRAVCAAVTLVKHSLMVTDRAQWLLESNYSTSGPTLEILVSSLYPKRSVLSALCDLCHPLVPVLPGEKQFPAAYPDCLHKYRVPAPLPTPYQNKKRENAFPFPKESQLKQSHG